MNYRISRKKAAIALAPVAAGFVGVGLAATPAHAAGGSDPFSFVDTDGETHDCTFSYDLTFEFDGPETLLAQTQMVGDEACRTGIARTTASFEQADGDHVRVDNAVEGAGGYSRGEWDNVRNVGTIAGHRIETTHTMPFGTCDPDATALAFEHGCVASAALSHGK